MRNLIWFVLLLLFAACSAPQTISQAPTIVVQASSALISPTKNSPVVDTTVPTQLPTPSPPRASSIEPTLAPRSTPVPSLTGLPPITLVPAATRSANAIVSGPGPVCNRAANASEVAEGELGSPERPVVIALVLYRDREVTAEAGAELAACLGEINGLTYAAVVGATPRETIDALATGQAQLAFLDALSILYGQQEHGFETGLVILRTEEDGLKPYSRRAFFANKAAGIKTFADLVGKTFCFGERDDLLNTTLPGIIIAANGVDPVTDLKPPEYSGFADTIAMTVYRGECDAGSGYNEILTFPGEALKTYPDLADNVELFYVSDPIPNDGVQFARGLDPQIQEATTNALLTMAADNPGKHPPLVTLYKIEGFVRAGNEFYAEIGELVKQSGVNLAEIVK